MMGLKESSDLPLAAGPAKKANGIAWWKVVIGLTAVSAFTWFRFKPLLREFEQDGFQAITGCEQVEPLDLKLGGLEAIYDSDAFRNSSIDRLSRIVQIPTISYDDMGNPGDDERFEVFFELEEYLKDTFPAVHKELKKENVNTHGLLYIWEGTNQSLKPTILMAHQDVVPVEKSTVDDWTHPPFSGYFDGKYVWGRGSSDCKNQLIAVLEAVETLLNVNFKPKRTLILSFGFDEEIAGVRGAGALAERITEIFGKDSVAAIVDEGSGLNQKFGAIFATPAVGEKGYTDVHITVRTPGGHSSVPSRHTGIGIISEVITLIEEDTYQPWLSEDNPILQALQCNARFGPDFPKKLRRLLSDRQKHKHRHSVSPNTVKKCQRHKHTDHLAEAVAAMNLVTRYQMQTSQAVDLIAGGAKVNALPERVEAVVNHRINIGETTKVALKKIAHLSNKVAKRHNLTLIVSPEHPEMIHGNSITITTSGTNIDPAPSTPLDIFVPGTENLSPWGILSGTTRGLYGEDLKMSPGLSTGGTDTRYYWDLTKHIFRYNPGYDPSESIDELRGIHTVNERQSIAGHINSVKWFAGWIKNIDEAQFE